MKTIIINGSPRKNFNTAKLLKEAQKGAELAGAETEFINLYEYNYKGCMSCFACKLKNSKTNGLCAIKDELQPVLEKCINADAIILGSPVYFSHPTGMLRSFLERLMFPCLTYIIDPENGGLKRFLNKTIPVGVIYTMNCPKELMEQYNYPLILEDTVNTLKNIFGKAELLYSFDTYQFTDYTKYEIDLFDEKQKAKSRDEQFPKDLQSAFNMGKRLASK